MSQPLKLYNSLFRQKELFEPMNPPFVGLYVCGPTVYSDVHLGNCRTFITFDVIYRYLVHIGYQVRYVRNITDVGHLESDADEGEDKIARKARLEKVEPMEIVQRYTRGFHHVMDQFNLLPPNIEPSATAHILDQINMVKRILKNGYAYESNGSVYFDVKKYAKQYDYGKLSGKVLEELMEGTRELEGQQEKRQPFDFAIWKKAAPEHIMRWNSPWGEGFPGWHLECSVMSTKYLGEPFDIHGGGMDLKFPHHECEIAQSVGADGVEPVKHWIHTNMLTVNGQKMSKSLGNSFLPQELFTGSHELLRKGFSPMTVKFFMLQAHYSSTLDFSNQALEAAEKGHHRLMNAYKALPGLELETGSEATDADEDRAVNRLCDQCYAHMNDDFNTAQALAMLFELSTKVNSFKNAIMPLNAISHVTLQKLKQTFKAFVEDIFGFREETVEDHKLDDVLHILIDIRNRARANRDFATADAIRDQLKAANIQLKDEKGGGTVWEFIS